MIRPCPWWYDLAHKLYQAHSSLHQDMSGWAWAKVFGGRWCNSFFSYSRECINGPLKSCSLNERRDWLGGHSGAGDERDWHSPRQPDSVSGRKEPHQFLVVRMRHTFILGANFLKSGGVILDIANGKLCWPTGESQLVIKYLLLNATSQAWTTRAEHAIDASYSSPMKQRPWTNK